MKIQNIYLKKFIWKNKYLLSGLIIIILLLALTFGLELFFNDRIYPGVVVLNLDIGGKKMDDASFLLSQSIITPEKIFLSSGEKTFELSLADINFSYDFDKTTNQAYRVYRNNSFFSNLFGKITSIFSKQVIDLSYTYDADKLDEYLQVVSEQVLSEPVYPEVKIDNGNILTVRGSPGDLLDKPTFMAILESQLIKANYSPIIIPLIKVDFSLNEEEANTFKERAEKYLGKSFSIKNEFDTFNFEEEIILSFLDYSEKFNIQKINNFIDKEIAPRVERLPQNAVLRFENDKVIEFIPAKDGLSIEKEILIKEIIDNISILENSEEKSFIIIIPVKKASPEITLNEVNNLGIKELLGRGTSKFKGSIPGRVHNISLASSKFNGTLIPPGEIFSFNNTLGDVSTFTGYKQAYIIKDGRTVLGDGGGVCQVSTTLFRAILNAGLPINERRSHSYRVSYYEQDSPPGLDATVYSPSTDLKFTNDTPGYLLIQTEFNPVSYSLVFEIYGTSDDRKADISKPVITSSIAPPEDLYIDDPGIPEGSVKQIDYKAWGAKVVFNYVVEKEGQIIIEKTYTSNYQPWQAVFLRGIGPVN